MSTAACSLLGLAPDRFDELTLSDFESGTPRWCPGCGDHSVLASMQRLLAEEGLAPEKTVFVSGIGCSSRVPHYMKTYGFHGLHGRALPVATGIKLHRPDLNVFVVMGDGDCTSIGAGHWLHATRYNSNMVALLLDNNVYGLTKNQTSPTTPQGHATLTQPGGSYLPALDPVSATLGISNASFVAQTAEWLPPHLFETLKAAYRHPGFSFVRILQRCPKFSDDIFAAARERPASVELLEHQSGVVVPALARAYPTRINHDPHDLDEARRLASEGGTKLGLFYCDPNRPRYDVTRSLPVRSNRQRVEVLEQELDKHAV